MVVATDDGYVLRKARPFPQILRQEDPPLRIQITAHRIGEERAHLPLADIGKGIDLSGKKVPVFLAVDAQAAVHGQGDENRLAQFLSEAGRNKNPALVVKRVLVLSRHYAHPFIPTFHHNPPLCSTIIG